ncbi:branched-chain amino acid ABC transporter permease [Cupriavidus necator]|nr:branched-chain amino acid ABC transporter permease [Cupriavidus necator]
MSQFMILCLSGLAFSSLLYLLASGFSLIFGLMRIPNMAHGAFFMLGAYLQVWVSRLDASFAISILVPACVVAMLGLVLEGTLLRWLKGRELAQVLGTLGVALVLSNLCLIVWGGTPLQAPVPDWLSGSIQFGAVWFPIYRVFVCLVAIVVAGAQIGLIERTQFGAMVRAGVDDPAMAEAVGIPVARVSRIVFAMGSASVGAAGALAAPMLTAYPGLDIEMLPLALAVVIVGGAGSLYGAVIGSLVVGFIYTFGQTYLVDFAAFALFAPVVVILAFRPAGLYGRSFQ